MKKKNSRHIATHGIRTQTQGSKQKEHSAPIYMTSSFQFNSANEAKQLFNDEIDGNVYTRYSNPNTSEFIEKLCQMEGTEDGIATSSGMAAMFSSMAALLSSGDHILACRSLFGSTHQILTSIFDKWNIQHTYVPIDNVDVWEKSIKPNTKMIFLETPSNPGLEIVDLEKVGHIAKKHNLILNVDNCFATPVLQKPKIWGADIITHSATKFIDGQGRTIAGAILASKEIIEQIRFFVRHTGPCLSPFNAWILSKSLETLEIRMKQHCNNALEIANCLESHEKISQVNYPLLKSHPQYDIAKKQMTMGGSIITIILKGSYNAAVKLLDNVKMLSHTPNLGDTRSIITHPASTTHSKLTVEQRQAVGITDGLVRISIGLENVNDILEDIIMALKKI